MVDSSTPCTKSQPVTDLAFMAVLEVGSFVNTLEKNSHTAITLRREQRCTEGTVLGDWHCTRHSQSQENKKLHPLPRIELFSVHKQAQQSLFQTLDLSASLFFFAGSSPLCECPLRKGTSAFNSRFVVCLFCYLFCFAVGKGGVIT